MRKSGQYSIHVLVENANVRGSPFLKTFLPGPIDPHKTLFLKQTSTVVCVTGQPHKLTIDPRDKYTNTCRKHDFDLSLFKFQAEQVYTFPTLIIVVIMISQRSLVFNVLYVNLQIDENLEDPSIQNCSAQFAFESCIPSSVSGIGSNNSILNVISPYSASNYTTAETGKISLQIKFKVSGVFNGTLTYDEKPVQNGKFDIIVLNTSEASAVQKNVAAKTANSYYEAKLLSVGNDVQNKLRKVYISVTSKQLVIKEYFLKVLPRRIATFRLSPNTKVCNYPYY